MIGLDERWELPGGKIEFGVLIRVDGELWQRERRISSRLGWIEKAGLSYRTISGVNPGKPDPNFVYLRIQTYPGALCKLFGTTESVLRHLKH